MLWTRVNWFTKTARKAAYIQIQQNKQNNINLKLFPKLNANPQIAAKLTQYIPKLSSTSQTDSSQINSIHPKPLRCPF